MGWGGSAVLVHVVDHRARAGSSLCLLSRAGQDPNTWLGTEVTVKLSSSAECWILGKHSASCMEQDSLLDWGLHFISHTLSFTYPKTLVLRL